MAQGDRCKQCGELLDQASSAIVEHLRAQSRLDLARCRRDLDRLPQLEASVTELAGSRAAAVQAYKAHRASHP
jgi:hypothetical protein